MFLQTSKQLFPEHQRLQNDHSQEPCIKELLIQLSHIRRLHSENEVYSAICAKELPLV